MVLSSKPDCPTNNPPRKHQNAPNNPRKIPNTLYFEIGTQIITGFGYKNVSLYIDLFEVR